MLTRRRCFVVFTLFYIKKYENIVLLILDFIIFIFDAFCDTLKTIKLYKKKLNLPEFLVCMWQNSMTYVTQQPVNKISWNCMFSFAQAFIFLDKILVKITPKRWRLCIFFREIWDRLISNSIARNSIKFYTYNIYCIK